MKSFPGFEFEDPLPVHVVLQPLPFVGAPVRKLAPTPPAALAGRPIPRVDTPIFPCVLSFSMIFPTFKHAFVNRSPRMPKNDLPFSMELKILEATFISESVLTCHDAMAWELPVLEISRKLFPILPMQGPPPVELPIHRSSPIVPRIDLLSGSGCAHTFSGFSFLIGWWWCWQAMPRETTCFPSFCRFLSSCPARLICSGPLVLLDSLPFLMFL
mmetsp:Transcript_63191/g.131431  ORF Transcript_63191/g.131431 Transcript_63191/m.131431 type:complete len:214 (-) Transcript_63191:301-942(-)